MTNLLILNILLLMLQDLVMVIIPSITYLDEVLVFLNIIILLIIICLKKNIQFKLSRYEKISFLILFIFITIGIISNINYKIIDLRYAILSLLMTIKGYLLYFQFRLIYQLEGKRVEVLKKVATILTYILYGLVSTGILDIIFNFLETKGMRFGIKNISIGFSHTTELAFFSIMSMLIILINNRITNNEKGNKYIIMLSTFLVFLSGRSKAIAFIVIFIIISILLNLTRSNKIRYFFLTMPIAIYIALPRIRSELMNGARGELYRGAISIANDFYPLGSGFGTYGSHISKIEYSSLYFYYDLYKIWGLSPQMSSYITDTYWAMILGECGWFGLILMLVVLTLIFLQFLRRKYDYKLKFFCSAIIAYSLITSIAEPIYSSNKCAALFCILALLNTIMRNDLRE